MVNGDEHRMLLYRKRRVLLPDVIQGITYQRFLTDGEFKFISTGGLPVNPEQFNGNYQNDINIKRVL